MSRTVFRFAGRGFSATGDDAFLDAVGGLLAPYVERGPATAPRPVGSARFGPATGVVAAVQEVRSTLLADALRDHAPLHGAVVTRDGTGIVLTGPKGAGKTSFVSALLRCSPEWDFVTNDKSVVSPSDGSVLGLPYAVAVGHAGLTRVPELADRPVRRIAGKNLFWPADFATALGSRPVPATPLSAVVLCEADFAAAGVEVLTDVGQAERLAVLRRDMTDFGDAMIPERLRGAESPPLPAGWPALPWIRLRGNPWAMRRDTVSAMRAAAGFQRVA
jgi:hypothetical protein